MKKRLLVFFLCITCVLSMTACNDTPTTTSNTTSIYENVYDVEREVGKLTWPEGQALPSFAYPAETIEVINVGKESVNEQRLLVSLQGIVNRTQPRIALCNGDEKSGDAKWLSDEGVQYAYVDDYQDLILKYKDEIKGLVIWDTKEIDTINLAHTYAGIHDALAVTAKQADTYTQEPYNFTVLEDYTGDFENKLEVYQYMYDHLWQDCDHRLIMGLSPDLTITGTRDLGIAAKSAFTFTNLENEEEIALMEKFLGDMRPGQDYYCGWFYNGLEYAGITLNSRFGIGSVPCDYYNNYSIHASLSREINMPTIPAKPELENKYYIAFVISDGDNLQYVQGALKEKWNPKQQGKYPISWTHAPTLLDAGPQMLNYFYNTATEQDCFITGPSGAGYTDIASWDERYKAVTANGDALATFAKRTDTYLRKSGMRVVTVWTNILNSQCKIYADNAPSMIALARIANLDNQNQSGNTMIENTPFWITSPWYDGDFPRVQSIMEEALDAYDGSKPEFRIAQIVGWDMNVRTYNKMCDALKEKYGDKVEFVRADHLAMLYSEYHGGTYNVALRADVTASGSAESYDASQIVDGSTAKDKGWQSTGGEGQWITVDLGEIYTINRYNLSLAGTGYYDRSLNLKNFTVQYSVDGTTWTDIDTIVDNTDNILDRTFDAVDARYVKISVANAGADGVARIQDLEIYGKRPTEA